MMHYRYDEDDTDGCTDEEQGQQQPGQEAILRLPAGQHVQGKKQGHPADKRQLPGDGDALESVPEIARTKHAPA